MNIGMDDNLSRRYYRHGSLRLPKAALHNPRMGKKPKKKQRITHIKAWRKHRNLSQIQLADRVGITQGALSDLENGRFAYTQTMLEALADGLNCQPWDLIWRPPGAADSLREVIEAMDADEQKRALAVVQALKDSKAA